MAALRAPTYWNPRFFARMISLGALATIQLPIKIIWDRPAALRRATRSDLLIGVDRISDSRLGSAPALTSAAATLKVDSLASKKCFVSTNIAASSARASTMPGLVLEARKSWYTTSAAAAADSSTIINEAIFVVSGCG